MNENKSIQAGERTHDFNPDSTGMVCRTCQKHYNVHDVVTANERLAKAHAMNAHLRPRNGAELVSEKLSDGSLVWNVALVIGEQTIIINMATHFAAESFAEDFNHRVSRGHIVGA